MPADLRADAHFVGFVPGAERASYYASGDVLLCPAVGGTFGIIVLEAMAAGCAVVAADTPGFRNVMTDGVEGFLVDVDERSGARPRSPSAANRLLADRSCAAPLRGGRAAARRRASTGRSSPPGCSRSMTSCAGPPGAGASRASPAA